MEFEEYVVDLNADCVCGCMETDRFHKIFHFPNDYGASVVNNPKTGGFNKEGYRVMILKFASPTDYTVVTTPMFDTDVVNCKTWNEAVVSLQKIKDLKR